MFIETNRYCSILSMEEQIKTLEVKITTLKGTVNEDLIALKALNTLVVATKNNTLKYVAFRGNDDDDVSSILLNFKDSVFLKEALEKELAYKIQAITDKYL